MMLGHMICFGLPGAPFQNTNHGEQPENEGQP
jgi:hypothetical protein